MRIRWRLTLWFTFVLSGILVLSGLVTHTLLQNYLSKEIDDSLNVYSARVHGTLNQYEAPGPLDYSGIHSKLPAVSEFSSPGIYIQFIDKDGNIVVKSKNLGEQELPLDPSLIRMSLAGQVGMKTLAAGDGATVRVMASPLYLQDRTLVLEVGQSLQTLETTMNRVRWALTGGVLAALVLSSLLGYVVVRKTLAPVQQITNTARGIEESSDLGRKVNYHGPGDEVKELATTFDRMIERLDLAFQSQKQFIADASHELRRNLGEGERNECVHAIRTETERMTRIVDDLLVLAEVEGGQVRRQEQVSFDEVLMEGLTRAQQLAGNRKVVLGRHDALSVKGDVHRLKQMVGNLVDNAVKYTPGVGTITLSLVRDGDWARMDVSDTGVGIEAEHLPHIFERFYRVDRARSRAEGGTGLGLAIVKQIAESLGGRVAVSSESGKGSTFTVWLKL